MREKKKLWIPTNLLDLLIHPSLGLPIITTTIMGESETTAYITICKGMKLNIISPESNTPNENVIVNATAPESNTPDESITVNIT